MTFSPKVWSDALRRLQQEIPDFTIDAWIKPLAVKIDERRLVLGCPNAFLRDRIRLQQFEALEQSWTDACQAADECGAASGYSVSVLTLPEFTDASGRALDAEDLFERHASERSPGKMRKVGPPAAEVEAQVCAAQRGSAGPDLGRVRGNGPEDGATQAATTQGPRPSPLADAPQARRTEGTRMPGAHVAPPSEASPLCPPGPPAQALSATPHNLPPERKGSHPGTPKPAPSAGWNPDQGAGSETARKATGPAALTSPPTAAPRPPSGPRNDLNSCLDFDLEGAGPSETHPFSFENFIVGPCNALAREATLALARRGQQSLNQLYLGSAPGMGKTHLAKAAAIEARRMLAGRLGGSRSKTRHRVIYLTAEQFTTDFVSAMRHNRNDEWTKRYRGPIELLIVEDIPCLAGRTKTQEELAQTIRHVLDSGGRVLLTGDRPPRDLSILDECLRVQVQRGFVAELSRPDALVRMHLLRAKAAAGGVHLPDDCLDLLVDATGPGGERGPTRTMASSAIPNTASGSVRDLEGLLIQVVTTASLLGRSIDLELAHEAIDLKSGAGSALEPTKLQVAEVVQIVAAFFGKRPEALASRSRRRDVLVPRQLAMYLAHRYTEATLSEIGRSLGRDHPAVRNALTRVERQVLKNAPLRYQIEALSERLDQRLQEVDRA